LKDLIINLLSLLNIIYKPPKKNIMKKQFIFSLIFVAVAALAFTHSGENFGFHKSTGGPPAGYSGDPAGGNQNCTSCHSGNPAQMEAGWITSDIPSGGYIPGASYTITATATGASVTKFGFQISPQNSSGTFLGTLVNTGNQTQLSSNQNYIHQTSAGTSGSGSKTWTFNWIAPAAGSGTVIFYGAFNLTNSGNNTSGDVIKLSTLTVNEDTSTDIQANHMSDDCYVFPNPSGDYLHIHSDLSEQQSKFNIIDVSGSTVYAGQLQSTETTIDISGLPTGIYFVQMLQPRERMLKFIKQ
jgi:hypothetical protein